MRGKSSNNKGYINTVQADRKLPNVECKVALSPAQVGWCRVLKGNYSSGSRDTGIAEGTPRLELPENFQIGEN